MIGQNRRNYRCGNDTDDGSKKDRVNTARFNLTSFNRQSKPVKIWLYALYYS